MVPSSSLLFAIHRLILIASVIGHTAVLHSPIPRTYSPRRIPRNESNIPPLSRPQPNLHRPGLPSRPLLRQRNLFRHPLSSTPLLEPTRPKEFNLDKRLELDF